MAQEVTNREHAGRAAYRASRPAREDQIAVQRIRQSYRQGELAALRECLGFLRVRHVDVDAVARMIATLIRDMGEEP